MASIGFTLFCCMVAVTVFNRFFRQYRWTVNIWHSSIGFCSLIASQRGSGSRFGYEVVDPDEPKDEDGDEDWVAELIKWRTTSKRSK